MRFVVRLLRHRGRILPWRDAVNRPALAGDLRIEECLDEQLHRYVRTARLFDEANVRPSAVRPELLDVRIMAMSPQAFTLTGFERVEGVEYAQSWLVSERITASHERPPPAATLAFDGDARGPRASTQGR